MSARSPVPPSFIDPQEQAFLDAMYRRRRSAISNVATTASTAELAAKINEILQADRDSGQQEST